MCIRDSPVTQVTVPAAAEKQFGAMVLVTKKMNELCVSGVELEGQSPVAEVIQA